MAQFKVGSRLGMAAISNFGVRQIGFTEVADIRFRWE